MSTIKEILYGTQPIYRKNFIHENVKHLRSVQNNCNSNKATGLPGSRAIVRGSSSRPTSKSSQPWSRGHTLGTSVKIIDRPKTAACSNVDIAKRLLIEKSTSRNGSGTLSSHHRQCLGATYQPKTEKVVVSHRSQPSRADRQVCDTSKNTPCQCRVSGKEKDPNILNPTGLISVNSATVYKDAWSQTLEIRNVEDVYKDGVIVYPSASVLTARRTPLDKPIRLDSASQTDRDCSSVKICVNTRDVHSPVDVCANLHDVPDNRVCSDDVGHLNLHEMNIDDCKENVQNQSNITTGSKRSNSKQKSALQPNDPLKPPTNYLKGVVPRYLRERQQQWKKAVEDEIANTPDPSCPPGHVLLPEEERLNTLEMIKRDYAKMVRELNMMPVRADTLRIRQRKIELEQKLTKLEEATKAFSRPKVFVKVDE